MPRKFCKLMHALCSFVQGDSWRWPYSCHAPLWFKAGSHSPRRLGAHFAHYFHLSPLMRVVTPSAEAEILQVSWFSHARIRGIYLDEFEKGEMSKSDLTSCKTHFGVLREDSQMYFIYSITLSGVNGGRCNNADFYATAQVPRFFGRHPSIQRSLAFGHNHKLKWQSD